MKKLPWVSVLMPIYNTNPEYLKESIESILVQTFGDFEFLILNDSPENTVLDDVVKSFSDERIIYLKNNQNLGITQSRNKLLDLAQGKYVAIFDHDDISLPDRLQKEVEFLNANPKVGLVSGWEEWFGDKNSFFKTPENDVDIKIMMTHDNYISHTACMIRKEILDTYHIRYKEDYSPAEDYKLCADLMEITQFYNFQCPLVKYRRYANNTSQKQRDKIRNMAKQIRFELSNKYPAYCFEYERNYKEYNIKLFGFLPFLRIRNKKGKKYVYLWNVIPLLKM